MLKAGWETSVLLPEWMLEASCGKSAKSLPLLAYLQRWRTHYLPGEPHLSVNSLAFL